MPRRRTRPPSRRKTRRRRRTPSRRSSKVGIASKTPCYKYLLIVGTHIDWPLFYSVY